jgi:16S rRNA (uracil1498-N3)-methyltransferase
LIEGIGRVMHIYVPSADITHRIRVRLSQEKSHHVLTVTRAGKGMELTVFDGTGKQYRAILSDIRNKTVFIDIGEEIPNTTELHTHLVLCASMLKGEKMDLVVQKATELGVMEIQPVVSERTIVKSTRRLDRWRKIAEESCEQCGRAKLPDIHEPVALRTFFEQHVDMLGFIFWEEGGLPLSDASQLVLQKRQHIGSQQQQPVHIVIGPEGGITHTEIARATESGLIVASLGRRILRAETAAIVAIGIVQYVFEG